MQIVALITEYSTILDALALVSSLMMILFLMNNRRKYGRLFLDARAVKGCKGFAGEVSQQMISQQTQKAYDSLQRSLTQEFEALRMIGGGSLPDSVSDQTSTMPNGLNYATSEIAPESRRNRYRLADKMIAKGAGIDQILQRCGLAEGEVELLQGLHQLEQGARS
jgi:hypothetical protein